MVVDKMLKKHVRGTESKNNTKQPWYNKTLRQQRNSLLAKGDLLSKFPNDTILRGSYF